ncbi:MAG: DUF503 domain-containing protein [Deltaproteobacteria bacterium]|jgi:uncharacterized protein YlxP (DUF503 family)|nr:DUF503 domain-containing protein [Deltaproteobacteria bacterium]
MFVGVLEVTLSLEGNRSLKDKRRVISSLLGRVKARFNCSAAEVGAQDRHALAVLGFTVCGSDFKILNSVLAHLLNFVEDNAEAQVVDSQIDCATWDGLGEWTEDERQAPGKD